MACWKGDAHVCKLETNILWKSLCPEQESNLSPEFVPQYPNHYTITNTLTQHGKRFICIDKQQPNSSS